MPLYRRFVGIVIGAFSPAIGCAQLVSFGVVGGASLTQDFKNSYSAIPNPPGPPVVLAELSSPERYIVGGMVEFQLPGDWSIEADGLFHTLRFDSAGIEPNGTLNSVSPSPVATWEFPVLAKYRFRWREWRPFLEAGPSFRTAGNLNGTNPSHDGIAAGAGLEARVGKFRIAPEVRYIRWAADTSTGAVTRPDQIELLTSFSTGSFEQGRPFGSHIALGVVAGATLTPDYRTFEFLNGTGTFGETLSSNPGAFLVGPMLEVAIARGFLFEGDAIHQPMIESVRFDLDGSFSSNTQSTPTWSFPLLGKYKFRAHGVSPFVEAGPAFRVARYVDDTSPYGVAAGVGVERRVWRMAIAPSVRFTHWDRPSPGYSGDLVPFQNQVEFLAGAAF